MMFSGLNRYPFSDILFYKKDTIVVFCKKRQTKERLQPQWVISAMPHHFEKMTRPTIHLVLAPISADGWVQTQPDSVVMVQGDTSLVPFCQASLEAKPEQTPDKPKPAALLEPKPQHMKQELHNMDHNMEQELHTDPG
jgi:hypothetical protein